MAGNNHQISPQSLMGTHNSGAMNIIEWQPAFRAQDVGYFNLNLNLLAIEAKKNHQIYHNVFRFMEWVWVKQATVTDAALILQNLNAYLLEKAEQWYTAELNYLSRLGLQNNGIEEWCRALKTQFWEASGKALVMLKTTHYMITNVW